MEKRVKILSKNENDFEQVYKGTKNKIKEIGKVSDPAVRQKEYEDLKESFRTIYGDAQLQAAADEICANSSPGDFSVAGLAGLGVFAGTALPLGALFPPALPVAVAAGVFSFRGVMRSAYSHAAKRTDLTTDDAKYIIKTDALKNGVDLELKKLKKSLSPS